MASLNLKHIYKVYDGGVKAVNDFNMTIEDKEFIVLVGPSGCGKSTTLRMIAGLEDITAGELRIGDEVVNDYEPKDRNIAMVFQNYALYPHMTVYDNIAFGLRIAKVPESEINERVMEAANVLGITEYLTRKPKALSGGQRQRVALGRAIVRNPKVFLLDEPLSNLDAKLRAAMRVEITALHEKLATTFIYVTHDQVEAMTMGTRIVVMKSGYVQQIDTPENLFKYPGNKFVAGFIGTPQMNFFDAVCLKEGKNVTFTLSCGKKVNMPYRLVNKMLVKYMNGKHLLEIGVRPDDVKLYRPQTMSLDEYEVLDAGIRVVEVLGGETLIYANFNTDDIDDVTMNTLITIKETADFPYHRGDIIQIAVKKNKIHVFDKSTELCVKPRVPQDNVLPGKIKNGVLSFADQVYQLPSAIAEMVLNGDVELTIPVDSIILGEGEMKAKVVSREEIGNFALYEMEVGDEVLYAKSDKDIEYSGTVLFDFSARQLKISNDDFEVLPLALINKFSGCLKKVKGIQANGKKAISFVASINGVDYDCPNSVCMKLFNIKGRKVFNVPLRYEVSCFNVRLVEGYGLQGEVVKVLDYGREKFLLLDIGGQLVCVADDGQSGVANGYSGEVRLGINLDETTFIDDLIDIILV